MKKASNQVIRAICLLLIAGSLLPVTVGAQSDPLEGFSDWISKGLKEWKGAGLAVAVVKDGETVFEEGFGVKEIGSTNTVDAHTLFSNASTTKAFTALAVALLVDEGKLTWMDRVVDHLPEFRLAEPSRTMELRVIDLLCHRSGVRPTNSWVLGVDRLTGYQRLRFAESNQPVRSTYEYNNDMFVVAGVLIERVSGQSWNSFLRTRILEPLGMSETRSVAGNYSSLENRAMPHFLVDGKAVQTPYEIEVDQALTAVSMLSSVHDMTKWIQFLLNGTRIDGSSLLSEESFNMLFTVHTALQAPAYPAAELANSHLFGYGLGWFIQDYRGHKLAMHTGSIDGMIAIVGLLPEKNLGVVVFGNRDHLEFRHGIMYETFDRYLGTRDTDWIGDLLAHYTKGDDKSSSDQNSTESQRSTQPPSHEIEEYAGKYSSPVYGDLSIVVDNSSLRLMIANTPRYDGILKHVDFNVFKLEHDVEPLPAWEVLFHIDARNRIISLEVPDWGMTFGKSG